MKKKLLALLLFMLPCLVQSQRYYPDYYPNYGDTPSRTTYMNHGGSWFISLSGGVSKLFSEYYRELGMLSNIHPTGAISGGAWISPVWGVRFSVTGAKLQGYVLWGENDASVWYNGTIAENGSYIRKSASTKEMLQRTFLGTARKSKTGASGYLYDVVYAAGSLELMLNTTNLFLDYDDQRMFNFLVFGGLGYAHTFRDGDRKRTAVNSLLGKGGFIADFRLSDVISINLEGNGLILPEMFDRQVGGNMTVDVVTTALIGLTYKFTPYKFEKAKLYNEAEIASLNNQINRLRIENRELLKRPEYCAECPVCPERPTAPMVTINREMIATDYLPTPVFFRINSAVIDASQWKSIEDAVKYLNENPSAHLKITGYADSATGTKSGNRKISEKRAQTVYAAMVNKYKISPNRIEISFLGDDVQPFQQNDWNRVVVFIKE
ncbi:MAG: OmpA family protein [Bacteroidales bacterium]|jgi:outer membrane protein OmpA-like peptidoglycan-associated protein|nr:OmpA family protein [Bacteroidales bacterium]